MTPWNILLLRNNLAYFGFPYKFISWIMEYITLVTYYLVITGGLAELFQDTKGIWKGDPMSPYLFVLVMEYLQRELNMVAANKLFHFHLKCKEIKLFHICFTDDPLLFCKADMQSVKLV